MFTARSAAARLYAIIDRQPEIDVNAHGGDAITNATPDIEFSNVCFSYPERPDADVLKVRCLLYVLSHVPPYDSRLLLYCD